MKPKYTVGQILYDEQCREKKITCCKLKEGIFLYKISGWREDYFRKEEDIEKSFFDKKTAFLKKIENLCNREQQLINNLNEIREEIKQAQNSIY